MAKRQPARTKFRKAHKGRNRGSAKGCDYLAFGEYGIQALGRGLVTSDRLEAVRVAITRHLKRRGKVWCRVFPHKPVTKKPAETRMGKGKGPVDHYVAVIKPGTILYEIGGIPMSMARQALALGDSKLPFSCRFIARDIV